MKKFFIAGFGLVVGAVMTLNVTHASENQAQVIVSVTAISNHLFIGGKIDQVITSKETPAEGLLTAQRGLRIYTNADQANSECIQKLSHVLSNTPTHLIPEVNIELSNLGETEDGYFHGLATSDTIRMNCSLSQKKFTEVFLHELGHVHYFEILSKSGHYEDPFTMRPRMVSENAYAKGDRLHFVSDYAMTNAHEDFAESFALYLTQPLKFQSFAEDSAQLKAKYEFIELHAKIENH